MSPPRRAASPAPTASAAVYDALRDRIVRGRLAPGERVTEVDIAAQLGTSRTPAREALRRLQQDGLLIVDNDQGAGKVRLAVAPMTADGVRDLYGVAGALEGLAARQVAALTAAARSALAARLQEAENAFRAAARRRQLDWERLFETHDAFHRTFVEPLAGPRVRALLELLRPQLDRYEYLYAPLVGGGFEETSAEHAAIVQAIGSGSGDRAERAVRANWSGGAERLARAVDSRGVFGALLPRTTSARRR